MNILFLYTANAVIFDAIGGDILSKRSFSKLYNKNELPFDVNKNRSMPRLKNTGVVSLVIKPKLRYGSIIRNVSE